MPAGYVALLGAAQGDGTALTNTTTGASIIHPTGKVRIPGNYAGWKVGNRFKVTASGRISTVVTTPGTLTLEIRLGPTSNIIACTSPAFALNTVAKTNVTWLLEWHMRVATVGSGTAATLLHTGFWTSEAVIGSPLPSAGGAGTHMIPASAPAAGTGFDSTVENVFDLQADWSVANAANSILAHTCDLWDLGP